jgi:hypothetical protein
MQYENGSSNAYTGEPWIVQTGIHDADWQTQYATSLYWAMISLLTVGYGDIVPTTNVEKMFNIGR